MKTWWFQFRFALLLIAPLLAAASVAGSAQELGGAGTVQGTVKDPTGGVMVSVPVAISNPVSGFSREATTDEGGPLRLPQSAAQPVSPRGDGTGIPVGRARRRRQDVRADQLDISLALAGATTSVRSSATPRTFSSATRPRTPTSIRASSRNCRSNRRAGLNQVITLASPGVVADANGFFHPIGDHAQTQFSIDNQPVTDQQSRIYSNQISPDAVQSMEVITGVAARRVRRQGQPGRPHVTKSGLDQPKPDRQLSASATDRSSTPSRETSTLAQAATTFGNFVSFSALRTDRFLDPPEFKALHGDGDSQSLFDRVRSASVRHDDTLRLNVHFARSSFDVPNTYDQDAARAGPASEDRYLQHRARLYARPELEAAAQRPTASSGTTM